MNGRILVLLGVIALFIAVWSRDAERSTAPESSPPQAAVSPEPTAKAIPVAIERQASIIWDGAPAEVEIPSNLAVGQYRIVSTQGTVASAIITGPMAGNGADGPEFVVRTVGSVRWYFIRQLGSSPAGLPMSPAVESAPVATHAAILHSALKVQSVQSAKSLATVPVMHAKERDILLAQLRGWPSDARVMAERTGRGVVQVGQKFGYFGQLTTKEAVLTQRPIQGTLTNLEEVSTVPDLSDLPSR